MEFTTNPLIRWATNITEFGLEYASKRFYSLYIGVVESNEDLRQQGRVSARVGVLGIGTSNEAGDFTPDVHPKMMRPMSIYAGLEHGVYFPPEDGDTIYVSFDHGDGQAPRYIGSYWCNPDDAKSADTSHIPTEFKAEKGKGVPLKRGIKTGFGHGLIFCDNPDEPYVAIWAGEQLGKDDKGRPAQGEARRSQQITLSDTTAAPTVKGVDETVEAGIYANTIYGHRVALNDTQKTIMISGLRKDAEGIEANSIKIDDNTNKITVKTKGPQDQVHSIDLDGTTNKIIIKNKGPAGAANVVELDDTGKITIMTKGLQSIIIDDTTGQISVIGTGLINVMTPAAVNVTAGGTIGLTATGAITLAAVGGIAMGSGAPPPPAPPGVAIETGAGAKIINFVGAVTETVAAMTQTVTGAFTQSALTIIQTAATSIVLTAPTITLLGGLVTIGPAPQKVMTAALLTWLADHTHTGNLGGPTPVDPAFKALLGDATTSPFITQSFSAT